MCHTRLLPFTFLTLALVAGPGPAAQAQGNGKMTPYEIQLHKLEDRSSGGTATINMNGRVWVSTLVGEPVIGCNAEWSFWGGVGGEPVITINNRQISGIPREVLDQITLHSVKLGFVTKPLDSRMFARNTRHELACDPGAMEKPGGKPSFTVPGSYSWDEMFYVRDSYDGNSKSSAQYADKATAKQIMIHLLENGFSTESGSAKILTASLNLGAVVDWLEEKEKLAEEKLKEDQKKADAEKDKDDLWSAVKNLWDGLTKDESETAAAKQKSADDDFWSGKKAGDQKTAKAETDKFWTGDTADERKKRQAENQGKQDTKKKQLAAAKATEPAKHGNAGGACPADENQKSVRAFTWIDLAMKGRSTYTRYCGITSVDDSAMKGYKQECRGIVYWKEVFGKDAAVTYLLTPGPGGKNVAGSPVMQKLAPLIQKTPAYRNRKTGKYFRGLETSFSTPSTGQYWAFKGGVIRINEAHSADDLKRFFCGHIVSKRRGFGMKISVVDVGEF